MRLLDRNFIMSENEELLPYKIICNRSVASLAKTVNEAISQGYHVLGSPYFSKDSHCQCVILTPVFNSQLGYLSHSHETVLEE
jgi:hypothetical protein